MYQVNKFVKNTEIELRIRKPLALIPWIFLVNGSFYPNYTLHCVLHMQPYQC
jgi:hypothetical protein